MGECPRASVDGMDGLSSIVWRTYLRQCELVVFPVSHYTITSSNDSWHEVVAMN